MRQQRFQNTFAGSCLSLAIRASCWISVAAGGAACGDGDRLGQPPSTPDAAQQDGGPGDGGPDDGGPPGNDAEPVDANVPDADGPPDADTPPDVPEPCTVEAARVLVLHGGAVGEGHAYAVQAAKALREHRVDFEMRALSEDVELREDGVGHYAALLITDYKAFAALPEAQRAALDAYARDCDAGQYFLHVAADLSLPGGATTGSSDVCSDAHVEPSSAVLDLTRDGGVHEGNLPATCRLFEIDEADGFEPIAYASNGVVEGPWLIADGGMRDGVRRVFNGQDFKAHFLSDLLLLDSLAWLSPVDLGVMRKRYVGIDIDDVFMPAHHEDWRERKQKIQAEDVPALIATQDRISELIGSDFRFTLGFCAEYYGQQLDDPEIYDDAAGDAALVAARSSFYWFDHFYGHNRIVDQPYEVIAELYQRGHDWAEETGVLDYVTQYTVTPEHSGISQRWEPLYQAWRDIYDIRYSSDTSDAGAGPGNGFEFFGVHVAPRARAGIWAAQTSFEHVSAAQLRRMARGSIYREIVMRPVSIFMTHQGNFCRDRIGSYLFEHAFEFIDQWTSYEIINASADDLVAKHFELVPLE